MSQMLTQSLSDGMVRWLALEPSGSGVALRLHQVRDTGNADFFDVYEFPPLDEEEHHGDGRLVALYPDEDSAVRAAASIGGSPGRWVKRGRHAGRDLGKALD